MSTYEHPYKFGSTYERPYKRTYKFASTYNCPFERTYEFSLFVFSCDILVTFRRYLSMCPLDIPVLPVNVLL